MEESMARACGARSGSISNVEDGDSVHSKNQIHQKAIKSVLKPIQEMSSDEDHDRERKPKPNPTFELELSNLDESELL